MKLNVAVGSLAALLSLFLVHPVLAADPSDYPVKIHVAASELANERTSDMKGSTCGYYQVLTVTIDAKKYRLESSGPRAQLLLPGDYQARIAKDQKKNASEYFRQYELIFSDGQTVKYDVTGEFE
jgi:hypothetical protein